MKLASERDFLNGSKIGGNHPFFLIAGPCVIESRDMLARVCERMKTVCDELGVFYVFKSSFDKANRSSGDSPRGPGLDEGLKHLEYIKKEFGVPVLTDVHEAHQAAAVAEVCDILQIPAFLCRQSDLIQACADKGFEVHQVYGLTESGGPGCLLLGADALQRAGSTGRGFLHTEARGVGLDGSECRCGDPGEVPLRGPNLMVGCWSRPDATAQAFTRDGWLRTGDVGTMDDEGFVTLRDRLKDMLISRGENVYPAEVENLLLGHPQIADAAVLGLPSPKWGEVPLAVLVKKPGAALTEADLLGWCKGKLASLERPKVV